MDRLALTEQIREFFAFRQPAGGPNNGEQFPDEKYGGHALFRATLRRGMLQSSCM